MPRKPRAMNRSAEASASPEPACRIDGQAGPTAGRPVYFVWKEAMVLVDVAVVVCAWPFIA